MRCRRRWWVSSVLSCSSVPVRACIGPLNRESVAQHVCGPACCMNAELEFGVIWSFGGPELAGTPAQHTCSRCECAHGLCRRSSKLGFRLVVPRLRRMSVGRKMETKLSGSAELGFAAGGWGLDWVGSLWASSSKEKRHGNETVAQG